MRRTLALVVAIACASAFSAGCDRPDEETCRHAVENIQRLTQTEDRIDRADTEAAVRSCRANASKASVQCMINARTVEDLAECEGDLLEEASDDSGEEASDDADEEE